jgi:hypothetical protein
MVHRVAWILVIAGVVPFAGATIALVWGDSHIRIPAIAALVTYAAILLSYLGGIEGGLALREQFGTQTTRAVALGLSGVPALAAWGLLWLPSPQLQLGAATALFIVVWLADLAAAHAGLIPSWWVDLRTAATAIACAILGVALYLL